MSPSPVVVSSVITHNTQGKSSSTRDKGKGIAYGNAPFNCSATSRSHFKGISIAGPAQIAPAPTAGRKRSYSRQNVPVGGLVRSMLKRARAAQDDFVVVPIMEPPEE
uniref:Uncharacterized protein n=1 Tax=Cannabis sativa TaxID=3483 RepID=A0A803QDC4_CANSA